MTGFLVCNCISCYSILKPPAFVSAFAATAIRRYFKMYYNVIIVEYKLSEAQAGFSPNRSTLDNIFIINQTFEKCHEYNIDLHNIFVDYLEAFDSINRNEEIDRLNEYNIPSKLIKLIILTLLGTNAIVKINNEFTGKFEVQTGIKQLHSILLPWTLY